MFFTADGNADVRSYIQDNWTHLALVNSNGNEETRVSIVGDDRVQWTDGSSTNPLSARITVTGGDSDISRPTTLIRGEFYQSGTATTKMAEDAFVDATIEATNDEVTVSADIELPEL